MANLSLYLDEDSSDKRLVVTLRNQGYTVICAEPESKWDDERQLETAVDLDCAIFTHNIKHFSRIHKDWMQSGKSHLGIIAVHRCHIKDKIRQLLHLLETLHKEDMVNRLEYLNNWGKE